MNNISLLGDILVDLISPEEQLDFKPVAGGSIFNTACTLAKLQAPVSFYSAIGNDLWGKYLLKTMDNVGINSSTVTILEKYKTSVAFALIDKNKNASYDFYKSSGKITVDPVNLEQNRLFHFGSFFALNKNSRPIIRTFLKKARKYSLLISYDPNFRPSHPLKLYKRDILDNFKKAHIIKASIEDLENIFGITKISDAFKVLFTFNPLLSIITLGSKGAVASVAKRPFIEVEVPITPVVDTVGAGDNFTAGMLYYLLANNICNSETLLDMNEKSVYTMLDFANSVACESLKVKGAQVDPEVLAELKQNLFQEE